MRRRRWRCPVVEFGLFSDEGCVEAGLFSRRARWRAAGRPAWRVREAARKLRAGWSHEGVAEYRSRRQAAADFAGDSAEYRAAAALLEGGAAAVVIGKMYTPSPPRPGVGG